MRRAVLFFLFGLLSCSNPPEISDKKQYLFDLEHYFTKEAAHLNTNNTGITKVLLKNDVSEELTFHTVDWITELQPFMKINFNKPALINSFFIDSLANENKLTLTYTAKESSVQLKSLVIYFTDEKPDSLRAILKSSNLYYQSDDTLSYFGNGNYRISARNKPRIGKEVNFVLNGKSVIK